MRRLHARRVITALLAIVALSLLLSSAECAPPRSKQRPGARSRPAPAQNAASQSQGSGSASQANRQPTRTARAPARPANQAPIKPDAKTRQEFQKLIGANWIWSPAQEKDTVPAGDCYFRKTIVAGGQVEFAQVHIACDNQYELQVNGRPAGSGADWRKMDVHDVSPLMRPGINVICVKATNIDPGPAGLVARVIVKERGGTYENFSTDASWRTSIKHFANWAQPEFRDREWLAAKVYGPLGAVLPWGDEVVISSEGSRFMIDPEFAIERLVADEQSGSLIAMTFSAKGDILASQEGGPLLLIRDADGDGTWETVQTFCEDLKNVQGILSLGSYVLAVGEGPEGGALYRMTDQNDDGRAEDLTALVRFRGLIGEHGPHALQLGPEGLIYVLIGNFARADATAGASSPYQIAYEGELVVPRYEDPQGHAVGVPAPGGTVVRTDVDGSFVEVVAGGFRNPYDFAFNDDGELFTYDADMEWDIGAPWYRPTRVHHVPPGAEFGWRSGWAKWPDYYLDALPGIIDVGAGSPTGVVYYDHVMFPKRLQGALIVGDWALGQIHAVQLERQGASYSASISTILKGRPLNVTDLDVGPDGALYFSTGGRGTDGGVYRVRWNGTVPSEATQLGRGIEAALRQPQFQSDWARRRIALVQRNMGDQWGPEIERVLGDPRARRSDRLRALDLLTFFGPAPTFDVLSGLSRDRDPAMRARAARLMGTQQDAALAEPLLAMLRDPYAYVRRVACEAIARRGTEAPVEPLVRLLADPDRFVAFAARRALERIPADQWQESVLTARNTRTFLQGSTGLMAASPSRGGAERVLERCAAMLRDKGEALSQPPNAAAEAELRDLVRVIQLALIRGQIPTQVAPGIAQQLVDLYPTTDALVNRELVRLLVYLEPPEAARKLAQQLESNIGELEKLQIAAYAARLTTGWQTTEKLTMLRYFESVRSLEGGHSVSAYIENFARDFFTNLTLAERRQVLAAGERFPTSALSILAKLPPDPGSDVLAEIRALDERLDGLEGEAFARLRVGTVAILGGSVDEPSFAYLRSVYRDQPQRRTPVAMSLTQHPDGENWDVLVDSLRTIEGVAVPEVLSALVRVSRRPETAEPYRNVILLGLRTATNNGERAIELLEHWTGQSARRDSQVPVAEQLAAWQAWFAESFPDSLPAELPHDSTENKWSYEELASYLETPEGKSGNAVRGEKVFRDAQCSKCHRFNGSGESIGPDLSAVARRFQRKEILESIVFPSHVVSDQYASHVVIAGGRTYTGMTVQAADGSVTVLQSDGVKVRLEAEDIEEIEPSKLSSMPEGLLNPLTLEQVADLFAFLMNTSDGNMAGRNRAAPR